jgi:hypothetical protein
MKKIFEKNPLLIFIIPLAVFFLLGCGLLYLALFGSKGLPLSGWIMAGIFTVIPAVLIYGFLFGFSISEKQQQAIEARRTELQFDQQGMTMLMPLFDQNCFIQWDSIDTILYAELRQEDYSEFTLYLNALPSYTKTEKQWWLNRLFPQHPKRKKIKIRSDCRYFETLPDMLKKYLDPNSRFEFKDSRKGLLLQSETIIKDNLTTRTEKWLPVKNYEPLELVYDRYNRTIDELKKETGR